MAFCRNETSGVPQKGSVSFSLSPTGTVVRSPLSEKKNHQSMLSDMKKKKSAHSHARDFDAKALYHVRAAMLHT